MGVSKFKRKDIYISKKTNIVVSVSEDLLFYVILVINIIHMAYQYKMNPLYM